MAEDSLFGPRLKIKRAYRHVQELHTCIRAFLQPDMCEISIEYDPQSGYNFLELKQLRSIPDYIPLIIGDVVHNLRTSLDLAVSVVVRNARLNDSHVYFPFHETRENLVNSVYKGKIQKANPAIASFIVEDIRPYKAGNYPLWALNKLDVIDKHRLLIPVLSVPALRNVSARDSNFNVHMWQIVRVEEGRIRTMMPTGAPAEITNYGEPVIGIFFPKGQPFENEPVVPTLHRLVELAARVIDAIAAIVVPMD